MKSNIRLKNWWLLLLTPILLHGVCNKENVDVPPPNADQYVTWKINGASGNLQSPVDSLSFYGMGNSTAIYGSTNPVPTTAFAIAFVGSQQSGTYSADYIYLLSGGKYYVSTAIPLQVSVTTYGTAGQYVIGTYSGNVKDSTTSAIIPVSGEFRIKNR